METHCAKKCYLGIVSAALALLVVSMLFCSTVFASTYGSLINQPSAAITSPPVVLQAGTSGASTIYSNSTSAKVSVSAPVGITHGYAFNSSNVKVTTTNGASNPANDSQAILNIVLSQSATAFIAYNAGNTKGSTENSNGKGCIINVDGTDLAYSWQSPNGANTADSVTVVCGVNLTSGSHIIKGRFFANSAGSTVTIDTRQIVAIWFPTVVSNCVRSTSVAQTSLATYMDDPPANATFTLNTASVVFIVYNVGNKAGSTEPAGGKGVTINLDGSDIATNESQSPWDANYANSVTIAYVGSLAAGSHTVKGRFFSLEAGNTTTIDERQLTVFCFSSSSITYSFAQSPGVVSTTSGTAVNDTNAVLTNTFGNDSDSLAMYIGGNSPGQQEDASGDGVGLSVDGTDMSNSSSWQSPDYANYANSGTSIWFGSLSTGTHTVIGRFWSDTAGSTVTISNRQVLILAFPCANLLKIVNQATNAWNLNLVAYSTSNIGHVTSATISFHDGLMSDQIVISGGAITQSQGASYTLLAGTGSLTYVSLVNLQTSVTPGPTYLYVDLKIVTPNTHIYSIYIITFIIV